MRKPNEYLPTLLQAQGVIERVANFHTVSTRAVRIVGALSLIPHQTTQQLANFLQCHYDTALAGVNQALAVGWVAYGATSWRLSVTLIGANVASKLKRGESEARGSIAWPTPAKKKRAYVRKVVKL